MARIILATCEALATRVGLRSTSIGIALVVSAMAESALDPGVVVMDSNGYRSRGLFQMNDRGLARDALAEGVQLEQLLDPYMATVVMLAECGRQPEVVRASSEGTIGELVSAVTIYAERPASAKERAKERVVIMTNLFDISPQRSCASIG